MAKIYIAEIVYSELEVDGKWHLDSNMIAYNDKEYAQEFIDYQIAFMKTLETVKPKYGKIFELETEVGVMHLFKRQAVA